MRGLIGGYLAIGIIMLLIGFFATGPCLDKNRDVVSNVVFVLGWPVYLYDDVVAGNVTPPQWLHRQACEGGVVAYGDKVPAPRQPSGSTDTILAPPREQSGSSLYR